MLRAYNRAVKKISSDPDLAVTRESAGFIMPAKDAVGFQIFVVVARFSQDLLEKQPQTSGLLKGL